MNIVELVNRKQQEADALAGDIAQKQADLNARLAVVDRLHQLQVQSQFSTEEVTFLFEESRR